MAAGILMPMTRFALDPVLRKEGNGYGCCCTSKGYYNRAETFRL